MNGVHSDLKSAAARRAGSNPAPGTNRLAPQSELWGPICAQGSNRGSNRALSLLSDCSAGIDECSCSPVQGGLTTLPPPPLPLGKAHQASIRKLSHFTDWAAAEIARRSVGADEPGSLVLYLLTGAGIRLCRSMVAEIRGGSVDRTSCTMRALIEVMINARYVLSADTETRAKAFIFDEVRSNLTRARRVYQVLDKGRAPSMSRLSTAADWQGHVTRLENELADLKQRYGDQTLKWPPLQQRAQKGDSEELYAGPFSMFSEDEHLSSRALDRFVLRQGDCVQFTFSPRLDLIDSFLSAAHLYMLTLLGECSKRLSFPNVDELQRFGTPLDLLIPMASNSELELDPANP